jgi:16S rRNA (cytosine1402-N4)-methyltransferase
MRKPRSTPEGQHRAVLLAEVLEVLSPAAGEVVVDCTLGWAGHSAALAERLGESGRLIGMDLDAENLERARERLQGGGCPFTLHHLNFAGIAQALADVPDGQADMILADLGMSSMQLDDPQRGFSYARPGPLDMRMDRTRGKTAAQVLASITPEELAKHLREWGDEPFAEPIAQAVCARMRERPLQTTAELAQLILDAVGAVDWRLRSGRTWKTHPAARTFQALRIVVNRELANLAELLRVAPYCLRSGGRLALISFHSGEDRLVKNALKEGHRTGVYRSISDDPIRPTFAEKQSNPRSRSAKLRWAIKS